MTSNKKIIAALDTHDLKAAEKIIDKLRGPVSFYKIGFELFSAHGWKAVDAVHSRGGRVFLDLKFHDIPNTVKKAVQVVCDHGIAMMNVHALGGLEMMKAAAGVIQSRRSEKKSAPLLIGVTVLTSHGQADLNRIGIQTVLEKQVLSLASLAKESGLDGVVCSPLEVKMLREQIPQPFCLVTPGVRPEGDASGDQKRVMTPKEAVQAGADYLVIGRPITEAPDPEKKALEIIASIDG